MNFGDSVQLTCHVAKGNLPLKITWKFNDKPLFAHLNILTSKLGDRTSFLTIPSVTAENSGNYTCDAWNEAGQHNYTARLNVLGTRNNLENFSQHENTKIVVFVIVRVWGFCISFLPYFLFLFIPFLILLKKKFDPNINNVLYDLFCAQFYRTYIRLHLKRKRIRVIVFS